MNGPDAAANASFRALHAPGRLLILPNAWDAGSARLVAACGAEAVATTSAGLAWSHGYPDGNVLPVSVLRAAVGEIARVISIPLTVDIEAGYSAEPRGVGELVAAIADAGAVGVNLEDGRDDPDLLCARIAAARSAAERAGVDLFVNARTDVYLAGLAPDGRAVAVTLDRARRYREAGCDGLFVPCLAAPADIRAIVAGIGDLPLNVMAIPGLPPAAELRGLGVRRLSAGAGLAAAAYGRARRLATDFLRDGRSEPFAEDAIGPMEMNALFVD
ncbi:MAG TPA: isocitrate lyase/phosphoenolpyruvate mutase family protein [Kofleriaceae bacterium]|nr:isocitrate lyase/phosphoenolpyruvate mutase family protein [Kofleriaceae bacterium]